MSHHERASSPFGLEVDSVGVEAEGLVRGVDGHRHRAVFEDRQLFHVNMRLLEAAHTTMYIIHIKVTDPYIDLQRVLVLGGDVHPALHLGGDRHVLHVAVAVL